MQRDELSNQLKSQNLSTVNPSAFLQVGGPTYPDTPTLEGLEAFRAVVDAFRAVHLPSYGSPIALSGGTASLVGDGDILAPTNQQVALISALQCENIAVGTMDIVIAIGGVAVSEQTLPAAKTTAINLNSKYITKNTPLSVSVLSGDAADLTTTVAYALTSQ
jgi:hypothetical protein